MIDKDRLNGSINYFVNGASWKGRMNFAITYSGKD